MAKMWNHPSCLAAWGQFSNVLKDGRSGIDHAFGKTLYEHLAEVDGGTICLVGCVRQCRNKQGRIDGR